MHSSDQEKTGATIFINQMALPLVVPQCEVGGRSPRGRRNLCAAAAVLVVLGLGPHVPSCTAIDANGHAM